MSRILKPILRGDNDVDVTALISKDQLCQRFDLPLEGSEWVDKQRTFLMQACTACLLLNTQLESKDALVKLSESIVRDNAGGFDAELIWELTQMVMIVQPPELTMHHSEKDPLEVALRSISDTNALGNLLHRFPQHGSAFVKEAEARLQE